MFSGRASFDLEPSVLGAGRAESGRTQLVLGSRRLQRQPEQATIRSGKLWQLGESRIAVSANLGVRDTGMAGIMDLEKHFAFYGAYHRNPINLLIHAVCVWPIFFAFSLLFAFTTPLCPFPLPSGTLPLQQYMIINSSFVLTAFYALFYVSLDKKAGSAAALLCLACWLGGNILAQILGYSLGLKVGLLLQVLCWGIQFIGHGVFEKRSPAVLDNVLQALLMAPFFILLEGFQYLFNYEPYPGFRTNVETKVQTYVTQWKAEHASNRTA